MIYLIVNIQENNCKIGYSANPEARLQQLQTGNPCKLELLSIKEGGIQDEKTIHNKFSFYRLQGEWFYLSEEIKQFFNVPKMKINCYLDDIAALAKCSGAEQSVVLCCLKYLDYNTNELVLNSQRRKEICECGNLKLNTVNTAISRLYKKNIFVKDDNKTYLNPKMFFYGTDLERHNKFKLSINYEICDNC